MNRRSHPQPNALGATRLIAGGFFFVLLALEATAPAQQLRLDDVFAPQNSPQRETAVTLQALEQQPGLADQLLQEARRLQENGRPEAVLRESEILAAWFPRESAEYGEVLRLRAAAFQALGRTEALLEVARRYLTEQPQGAHRAWFLARLAAGLDTRGSIGDAAALWAQGVRENLRFSLEDVAAGAMLLLRTGQPQTARELMEQHPTMPAPQRQRLLLEALLMIDDPAVPVPPGLSGGESPADRAAVELRRGMLLELRREHDAAGTAYQAARAQQELLPPAERALLAERLTARP